MNYHKNDFKLTEDQKKAIEKIQDNFSKNLNTVCCMGVGSGKTEIACNIIKNQIDNATNYCGVCLVMAPTNNILTTIWAETLKAHNLKYLILTSQEISKRRLSTNKEFCLQDYQVVLGTYSMYGKKYSDGLYNIDFFNKTKVCLLVLDEIHNLSNMPQKFKNIRLKIIESLAERRLGLTATPLINSLDEVLKTYQLLNPILYKEKKKSLNENDQNIRKKQIFELSKTFMIYKFPRKKLVKQLCMILALPLNKKERDLFLHLRANTTALFERSKPIALFLQKATETYTHNYRLEDLPSAYDIAISTIIESMPKNDKVIIFDLEQGNLNYLYEVPYLKEMKPLLYHGGVGKIEREQNKDSFINKEEHRALLATFAIASEGLNLQNANHIICTSIPWTPAKLMQAIGRIMRIGQTKPCFIYVLTFYDPTNIYKNINKETLPKYFTDKLLSLSEFSKYHENEENGSSFYFRKIPISIRKKLNISKDSSKSTYMGYLLENELKKNIIEALVPFKELQEEPGYIGNDSCKQDDHGIDLGEDFGYQERLAFIWYYLMKS